MARNTRATLALVLGIVLLLAAGCGTVEADVHMTYTDGGNVQNELTLRCTGAIASLMLTPELEEGLRSSGWSVTTDVTNEATTLTATASSKQGRASSTSLVDLGSGVLVTEGGNPFVKTYTTDFTTPAQDMSSDRKSVV